MERGFRDNHDFSLSRETALEERAERQLREMLRQNPDLQQYVSPGSIANAKDVLRRVRIMLRDNPEYFDRVSQALAVAASENPGKTIMAVDTRAPLILLHTPTGGLEGFAPVLGCTYQALGDLDQFDAGLDIVISDNGLIPYVQEQLESTPGPVISYHRDTMEPQDYLALATNHFQNETFRFRIQNDRLVSL